MLTKTRQEEAVRVFDLLRHFNLIQPGSFSNCERLRRALAATDVVEVNNVTFQVSTALRSLTVNTDEQ